MIWKLVLILWCLTLLWPIQIQAKRLVFADDFSNGLDNWQIERGSWSSWQEGAGWVSANLKGVSQKTEITPHQAIWPGGSENYDLEIVYEPIVGVDRNLAWDFIDTNNWYELHLLPTWFELANVVNGQLGWSVRANLNFPNLQIYTFKVRRVGNFLWVWIDNQLLYSGIDISYQPGVIGKPVLKATTGSVSLTTVKFHDLKYWWLDPADWQTTWPVAITTLKQTHPDWASLEYDSAQLWSSQPGFSRWGCLVTSITMIIKAYGYQVMPDGQLIDPGRLNDWLKSQSDGYVGEGMVNWSAVTRLVHQLHEKAKLVGQTLYELEYSKYSLNLETQAQEILSGGEPVIFQIFGHFLVADGLMDNNGQLSFAIKDPFYSYSAFSEHQQPLISVRRLKPSQTDLSAWWWFSQTPFAVMVKFPDGTSLVYPSELEVIQASGELLADSAGGYSVFLPKPLTGVYEFVVSGDLGSVEFFSYSQTAELQLKTNLLTNFYKFNYDKSATQIMSLEDQDLDLSWLVANLPPETLTMQQQDQLDSLFLASQAQANFDCYIGIISNLIADLTAQPNNYWQSLIAENLQTWLLPNPE